MIFPYYLLQQRDNPFLIKHKATMPLFSLNVSIWKKKVANKFEKTSIQPRFKKIYTKTIDSSSYLNSDAQIIYSTVGLYAVLRNKYTILKYTRIAYKHKSGIY